MGLWIAIALGSIVPLVIVVVAARGAFAAFKRRPLVWIVLVVAGAGLGAWQGWSTTQVVRKATPKHFDAARGESKCNFQPCDAKPAGVVEWQEKWTYSGATSTHVTPGAVVRMRFCEKHLGLGPEDFTFRLDPLVAIGGWAVVGLGLACSIAWFFTKPRPNDERV